MRVFEWKFDSDTGNYRGFSNLELPIELAAAVVFNPEDGDWHGAALLGDTIITSGDSFMTSEAAMDQISLDTKGFLSKFKVGLEGLSSVSTNQLES